MLRANCNKNRRLGAERIHDGRKKPIWVCVRFGSAARPGYFLTPICRQVYFSIGTIILGSFSK
jgi:hypothetical protein